MGGVFLWTIIEGKAHSWSRFPWKVLWCNARSHGEEAGGGSSWPMQDHPPQGLLWMQTPSPFPWWFGWLPFQQWRAKWSGPVGKKKKKVQSWDKHQCIGAKIHWNKLWRQRRSRQGPSAWKQMEMNTGQVHPSWSLKTLSSHVLSSHSNEFQLLARC